MIVDLDVPFFSNTPDNNHCFQAALKMVLKHFLPREEFSWEELDRATAKVGDRWTWPYAGTLWMRERGFEVVNIDVFDNKRFAEEGETYLEELYGHEVAQAQISHSDIEQERRLAREFIEKVQGEQRIPTLADVRRLLERGFIPQCLINSSALVGKPGYTGHAVVIKGIDDAKIVIHDPGLPPIANQVVDCVVFEEAWAFPDERAKNILAFRKQNTPA